MRIFNIFIVLLFCNIYLFGKGQYARIFALPIDSQLREITFYQNSHLFNFADEQEVDSIQVMINNAKENKNETLILELNFIQALKKLSTRKEDTLFLIKTLQQQLRTAVEKKLPNAIVYLKTFLAIEYYDYKKYDLAIEQYLQAVDVEEKSDMRFSFESQELYYNIAMFYYSYKDYKNCIAMMKRATETLQHSARRNCNEYNAIALCYTKLNLLDSAIANYEKALQLSIQYHETENECIIKGNLGAVYLQQKQYAKALPLIKIDADSNYKFKIYGCSAPAMGRLMEIACKTNNIQLATDYVPKALSMIPLLYIDDYNIRATLFDGLTMYYTKINNGAMALRFKDSSIANAERQKLQFDADKLKDVIMATEVNKYTQKLKISEQSLKRGSIIRSVIIICLLLVAIVSFLLIKNQKTQNDLESQLALQKHNKLEAEKNDVENNLIVAKEKLLTFTQNISAQNTEIEKLKDSLQALQALPIAIEQKQMQIASIEVLLKATILTEDDWQNFKQLFEAVYSGFFGKLKLNYPTLTAGETRTLALSKLNLSNKDIGSMLGISADSVKKSKQRISNKLDWDDEISFQEFVNGI